MLAGDPDFNALASAHSRELEAHIDETGLTPLTASCIANRHSACEALVQHGARLDDHPEGSDPVYFYAAAFPEIFPPEIPIEWICSIGSKNKVFCTKQLSKLPMTQLHWQLAAFGSTKGLI